jgi:hypothetical protein
MTINQNASAPSVLDFIAEQSMKAQAHCPSPKCLRPLSQQMRAVLLIFNADPYLMDAVTPHINLETESIYWDQIYKLRLCSGHRAAVAWAYGIWTDEQRPKTNCFDLSLAMSPQLKVGVLEALCLRWGLRG